MFLAPKKNSYPEIDSAQDRPRRRDSKADEIYRSFIKTIMDSLGVDEQTARFYRSAIKINMEGTNPELKIKKTDSIEERRAKDELKIKEMENIIGKKEKLQSTLDKIDLDETRRIMESRKLESEQRREEWLKNRPAKPDRSAKPAEKPKTTESVTSEDEPKPKKRTVKTAKKSNVAESGYLQSDEIIFSSDV